MGVGGLVLMMWLMRFCVCVISCCVVLWAWLISLVSVLMVFSCVVSLCVCCWIVFSCWLIFSSSSVMYWWRLIVGSF